MNYPTRYTKNLNILPTTLNLILLEALPPLQITRKGIEWV
jgi:hypothetical protein